MNEWINKNDGKKTGTETPNILDINLLKPNDIYICRTTALTSRRYILNIFSTNIHTEYFKHAA